MPQYDYQVPQDFTSGGLVYVDQLAIELDAAWSGAITFSISGPAAYLAGPPYIIVGAGYIHILTVETPDSGQISAMNAVIAAHVRDPDFAFTVAAPPHNPTLGVIAYLSDCAREVSGTGCPCYWDGSDWRRCSDDAVAST